MKKIETRLHELQYQALIDYLKPKHESIAHYLYELVRKDMSKRGIFICRSNKVKAVLIDQK